MSPSSMPEHFIAPPPSLKLQALAALYAVVTGANDTREQRQDLETIRRAIEALPDVAAPGD